VGFIRKLCVVWFYLVTVCVGVRSLAHCLVFECMCVFIHSCTLKMLGCFNPILGQIWTNPAIGSYLEYLTQNWVKTTQDLFECVYACLLLKEMGTWASCSNEFCEDMTQVS